VLAEQQRTSRAAAERKKWARFGVAAEVADNHSYTLTSQEQVMMETPQESREADENPSNVGDRYGIFFLLQLACNDTVQWFT
jgi:Eukaryotic translation initiation factor 3 subunit G